MLSYSDRLLVSPIFSLEYFRFLHVGQRNSLHVEDGSRVEVYDLSHPEEWELNSPAWYLFIQVEHEILSVLTYAGMGLAVLKACPVVMQVV